LDLRDLSIDDISGKPLGFLLEHRISRKSVSMTASVEPEVKAFGPPGSPRSSRYRFEIPRLVAEDGST